jgi:cytochrome c oxidase subunit 2
VSAKGAVCRLARGRHRRWQIAIGAGLAYFGALLLGGCAEAPSALHPQGPAAERIATLWWIMLGVAAAIYVLVLALLGVALFRRRSDDPDSERRPASRQALILGGGVIMPAVVLLGLFGLTLGTMAALAAPEGEVLTIQVVGRQWWWEVQYPDQQIVTANEIHIPVGQPVRLLVTSVDVIHSLWVPELNGKIDLVPGRVNTFWFQASQAGVYRGLCAEYCGDQHAKMMFLVVADPPEQFAAWAERERQPAAAPADDMSRQGQQVFLGTTCIQCHAVRGTSATGNLGPDLTHIASRQTLAAASLDNNRGNLGGWIVNPQNLKPGAKMPATELTGQDLLALLAYLESLK